MRIVIDTNIWVSYLLKPHTPLGALIECIESKHNFLYSHELLSEVAKVIMRDKFRPYIDSEDIRNFLQALEIKGQLIQVTSNVNACRDPKDNMILALARDGQADMIITGDKDLLTLHPFESIPIYTPSDAFNQIT